MMENITERIVFETPKCNLINGINHPPVVATPENSKSLWADGATGMPQTWIAILKFKTKLSKAKFSPWEGRPCEGGWAESNPECPWSFHEQHKVSACFKSCYQVFIFFYLNYFSNKVFIIVLSVVQYFGQYA